MTDPTRARDLRLIHAAARQMTWTEDTYRAILERVTGQASAAGLTARQRKAVLDEFTRLGWNPRKGKSHRAPNPAAGPVEGDLPITGSGWGKDRLLAKIGALLAESGRGWAYADGCARKMFQRETIRFCDPDQLQKIVAALTYDQRRRSRVKSGPPETA
ncbi:MAG: regulatory protein GemA [Candidatus Contendobacter sp.]|nr:regulatory protein GemA [Candidatus Contendobacter sp.]